MRTLTHAETRQLSGGVPPLIGAMITGGAVQATYDVAVYLWNTRDANFEDAAAVAANGFVTGALLGGLASRLQSLLRLN